jgi:hypothetical protein
MSLLDKLLTEDTGLLASLNIELEKDKDYNADGQIIKENWYYFCANLKQLATVPEYKAQIKKVAIKILVSKYFTRTKLTVEPGLEEIIKTQLKDYFIAFTSTKVEDFIKALFNLPFDLLTLIILYVIYELNPEIKMEVLPKKSEVKKYLELIIQAKTDFIKLINNISLGRSSKFTLSRAEELLDVKVFYEIDSLNVAVLEYMIRMLNNEKIHDKLYDLYGEQLIEELKEQILSYSNYNKFINDIKENKAQPFFTDEGYQFEEREETFDDMVRIRFGEIEPPIDLPWRTSSPPYATSEVEIPEESDTDENPNPGELSPSEDKEENI